jgi:thioredoxin 1
MKRPILPDSTDIADTATPYASAPDPRGALGNAEYAARSGKRVLAVFGADWCPDARRFASVLALPQLQDFLRERYEVVLIDVGRYDKNLDLAASYGLDKVEGAPAIIVADSDGSVITPGGAYDWRTARSRRPQEFADFLAVYAEAPAP